jgi:hypothetical protein
VADKGGGLWNGGGGLSGYNTKASPWTKVINVLGESQALNMSKISFTDFEKELLLQNK